MSTVSLNNTNGRRTYQYRLSWTQIPWNVVITSCHFTSDKCTFISQLHTIIYNWTIFIVTAYALCAQAYMNSVAIDQYVRHTMGNWPRISNEIFDYFLQRNWRLGCCCLVGFFFHSYFISLRYSFISFYLSSIYCVLLLFMTVELFIIDMFVCCDRQTLIWPVWNVIWRHKMLLILQAYKMPLIMNIWKRYGYIYIKHGLIIANRLYRHLSDAFEFIFVGRACVLPFEIEVDQTTKWICIQHLKLRIYLNLFPVYKPNFNFSQNVRFIWNYRQTKPQNNGQRWNEACGNCDDRFNMP